MKPFAISTVLASALLSLGPQGGRAATYGDLSGAGGPAPQMPYRAGPGSWPPVQPLVRVACRRRCQAGRRALFLHRSMRRALHRCPLNGCRRFLACH